MKGVVLCGKALTKLVLKFQMVSRPFCCLTGLYAAAGGAMGWNRTGTPSVVSLPVAAPPPTGAGLCLKGRGARGAVPEQLRSGHGGCESGLGGGRFLAVGNAVGAGVGL